MAFKIENRGACLPIIDNSELFDFQKTGNFNNYQLGLIKSSQDSLLTFSFYVQGGGTLTSAVAKKISKINPDGSVVIGEEIDILSYGTILESNETIYEHAQGQISVLDSGLYYYYFTDGNFEAKSEIFCIKDGLLTYPLGEVFNIFNTTGYSNNVILDDSGNNNHFTLTNGRCMNVIFSTKFIFSNHLDLSGYSISNQGTATVSINNTAKQINVGVGTIYNLILSKTGEKTFHFPFIENSHYIYDVNYNERIEIIGKNYCWANQNNFFYLGGMDLLTDDTTGLPSYAPKNIYGASCYLDDCDFTNEFKADVAYPLNYVIYEPFTKEWYKCTTAYTSSYFADETANWTLLT